MSPFWQSRIGSLICGAGIAWAVYIATDGLEYSEYLDVILSRGFIKVVMSPGPIEVLGLGVIIWLHAKWRSSVDISRA
jgi:hypothetical protein